MQQQKRKARHLTPPSTKPAPPHQRARVVAANQDYINRCADQAEARAAKALRHARQQLQRLRALNAALKDAAALPALLEAISQDTAHLQGRVDAIEAQLAAGGQ
jgi:hypothetical protein